MKLYLEQAAKIENLGFTCGWYKVISQHHSLDSHIFCFVSKSREGQHFELTFTEDEADELKKALMKRPS